MNRAPVAVSTARGASYLWLQNAVTSVSRVVAFAFFARLISVNEMGIFTILSLASSATSAFTGLGLSSIVSKFVAESMARGDSVRAASVYYKALLFSEFASVIMAVGFLFSKFPAGVSSIPNSPEVSLIGILFVIDVVASIGSPAAAAFYGLLEFRDYAIIYAAYGAVKPWLVVLLVYKTRSLVGLPAGWLIADSVLSVYVFLYLWWRLGRPVFKFDTSYLLKLSSPLYLASIASFLYGAFDQLTLIPFVSLAALGVYGAAVTAFSAYSGLLSVLGSVLLPAYSGVHARKGPEALKNSVGRASRYISIVAIPLAFALIATARPALTLLVGKGYDAGSVPLAILAVASIATIIAIPISPILIVLNETLLAASVSLLALPLSLGVELASIPVLGILGASIARGLSMLLSLLLTWYLVRRKIPIKLDYQAITKSAAASLAMALVMWSLQLLYYSRFLLPLYLAIGALVYLFAIRELKMLNTADIELARQVLGARFSGMCDLLARVLLP